ncbi:MAG: hypothetical protein KJP10_05405, partial [Gammaproteobacteria bacterium]|nr:hypothetical protein [Gammaproteobacteria bacterium]
LTLHIPDAKDFAVSHELVIRRQDSGYFSSRARTSNSRDQMQASRYRPTSSSAASFEIVYDASS